MFVNVGLDHLIVEWMKTRVGRIVSSTVCCVGMTIAAFFAVPAGARQFALARDPTAVRADVVETRTYDGGPENRAEVRAALRYRFVVDGRAYHFVGAAGNEWASVPKPVFEEAERTRRIDVIYRRADPWNNLPATRLRWLPAWGVGLIVVPIVLTALAWAWVGRVVRDEVRRVRPTENG